MDLSRTLRELHEWADQGLLDHRPSTGMDLDLIVSDVLRTLRQRCVGRTTMQELADAYTGQTAHAHRNDQHHD